RGLSRGAPAAPRAVPHPAPHRLLRRRGLRGGSARAARPALRGPSDPSRGQGGARPLGARAPEPPRPRDRPRARRGAPAADGRGLPPPLRSLLRGDRGVQPRRSVRHVDSILLNLAALCILTSAISVPTVKGLTREKARYAILLDNRPSMGALEPDGRTRLAESVDRAREFIRSLGYGDQVAVH